MSIFCFFPSGPGCVLLLSVTDSGEAQVCQQSPGHGVPERDLILRPSLGLCTCCLKLIRAGHSQAGSSLCHLCGE